MISSIRLSRSQLAWRGGVNSSESLPAQAAGWRRSSSSGGQRRISPVQNRAIGWWMQNRRGVLVELDHNAFDAA
jgi:hypothetical protein